MDEKSIVMNRNLAAIAAMDGRTLGHALLLSIVLNDAVIGALATDTLGRWAEFGFSPAALFCATRTLYQYQPRMILARDSEMHPLRLLLLGVEAAMVELQLRVTDALMPADLYAILMKMMEKHAVHAGRLGLKGNAWYVENVFFSGDDMVAKAMNMLGYKLRCAIGERMGWDEDRWSAVWFCTCDAQPLDEGGLMLAYQKLMNVAHASEGIAVEPKKKKRIRKVKAVETIKND